MRKLVYTSLLIALVAIPLVAARDPSPARGLRRAVLGVALFVAAYVFAIVYVVPRLPS